MQELSISFMGICDIANQKHDKWVGVLWLHCAHDRYNGHCLKDCSASSHKCWTFVTWLNGFLTLLQIHLGHVLLGLFWNHRNSLIRIILLFQAWVDYSHSESVDSVTMKVLQPLWNQSSLRTNNCLAYSNYSYTRIGPKECTFNMSCYNASFH